MESKEIKINLLMRKALVFDNLQFNSLYDFQLTEEDKEKACRELNESEDNKIICLHKLKEILKSAKNVCYRTDDDYLLRYLRWTKYDCDKAYKTIRKLYSLRNKYPDSFQLPSNLEELMNNFFYTYLPYRDEKGRAIFYMDFRKWNIDEMSINTVFVLLNIISDMITMNPHLQLSGLVGIWDFRGVSMRHVSLIKHPVTMWLMTNMLQNIYPWRIKQIVGIHCGPLVLAAAKVVFLLLKQKVVDRIKLIGSDMTELHQYFNPAILPKEYGGTLEESECSITDFIIDNLPYLKYERSFGVHSNS